jgi:glycosyltransferase involved in cell wall biosynthesis
MKILFISHDASRTGAPLLLLNLIKWLIIHQNNLVLRILLVEDGPLNTEFRQAGKVSVWKSGMGSIPFSLRLFFRIIGKDPRAWRQNSVIRELKAFNPDIIYGNSVGSCTIISTLKNALQKPVILHVHELQTIMRQYNQNNVIDKSFDVVDHFVAVSDVVRNNLVQNHTIPENRISLIYEYVDTKSLVARNQKPIKKRSQQKFVIGGVGFAHWRKGVEFFILVAKAIKDRANIPAFEFRWIGAVHSNSLIMYEDDIAKLGIQEHCRFTGEKSDLSAEYEQMDVLLLTSREDPFPVVAIEAACFYTPIICWDKAIGTRELVDKGCGIVVDYQDIIGMAEAIEKLYFDKGLYNQYATRANELAADYDIDIAARKIYSLICKIVSN